MREKEDDIKEKETENRDVSVDTPSIIEEINIEELAVDGICGIY